MKKKHLKNMAVVLIVLLIVVLIAFSIDNEIEGVEEYTSIKYGAEYAPIKYCDLEKITEPNIKCALSYGTDPPIHSCSYVFFSSVTKTAKIDGKYVIQPKGKHWIKGEFIPYTTLSLRCYMGSEIGENIEYAYCKGLSADIVETDSEGNVIDSYEIDIELIVKPVGEIGFEYIDAKCKKI